MRDIWNMLGIEPTNDKKAIRRAFAAQSRLHHPEEEPEYFAALNQAYKEALDYGAGGEKKWETPAAFLPERRTKKETEYRESPQESGKEEARGKESARGKAKEKAWNFKLTHENERVKNENTLDEKTQEEMEDSAFVHEKEQEEERDSTFVHEKKQEEERNYAFAHEEAQEKQTHEVTDKEQDKEAAGEESSLLRRLDQAAEQAIKKSMETGALHDFIVLFENPKQAKQADTWKRFFLTEAFLGEQFSEEFGKGLLTYLSEQTICPGDNLPMGLLQELAIAYAFIPHFAGEEYFEGLKYPKEWYKVSVENTFPGRRYTAEIFNMQGRECDLKSMTNRILRQPANKVRHNAFSDYLAMKEMSRDGRLTAGEREVWQHTLGACQPYYLFERNGKRIGGADYESRSECVVKLYVQWLKDEQLPEEVLLFLYKKLDFKALERSSTRGLYCRLKEEVLRQLPRAEEILFGEDGKEQLITKLYRTYSAIINDNQTNYDKFIYGETPEIRDRARAFFALPEWEQLKNEKALFERIYSTSKRIVMPRTVAETLVRHLVQGDFPEPERTMLTESLLRSLATEKMCQELDYRYEITLSSTDLKDIGDNPDFWQYFLMRGFGFRHAKVRGSWEEDYIYVMDGQCYLPAYINYIYAPSRAWQRRFVGFDEEREEIREPVSLACPLPGGRSLRVEFHYHYCLYFVRNSVDDFMNGFVKNSGNDSGSEAVSQLASQPVNEVQVTDPVLTFSELQEYAESLEKPEEFFLALAVTTIEDSDRSAARTLIEGWLKRIPLHPFIIPTVARMLAADNDRLPAAVSIPKETDGQDRHTSGYHEITGQEWHTPNHVGVAKRESAEYGPEEKSNGILSGRKTEAVLYSEQERFCFRALVSEEGFSIWRQLDYGWQDIIFRNAELGWRKCEEYRWEEYNFCCEAEKQVEENALDHNTIADSTGKNDIPMDSGCNISGGSTQESKFTGECAQGNNHLEDNVLTDDRLSGDTPSGMKDINNSKISAARTDIPEGRRAVARNVLDTFCQPHPRLRVTYSLEGMNIDQKSAKILEVMGCLENMEGYCVLRYGEKKEKRHDRVFYGARAPFGFELKAQSPAHVRSRDFLMASSNTKIKEPKVLAGRFGWGFKYSPSSDYGPMYVYQGQSGKLYAYGSIRMHRADSLDQLLADFFRKEWEGVTEVEAYEGSLTVSRLDHRLEYCYTEEDMWQSMRSQEETVADRFTLFGGYGMWMEFVRWMDEILDSELPSWVNVIMVNLDWEKGGALTFAGVHEKDEDALAEEMEEKGDMDLEDTADGNVTDTDETYTDEAETDESDDDESDTNESDVDGSDMVMSEKAGPVESDDDLQNQVYLPATPLLIWAKGMDRRDRADFLLKAMQWYVDCGRFAEKTGGKKIRILVN